MSQKTYGVIISYSNIILKNIILFLYTPFLLNTIGQSEYGLYQMSNSVITALSLLSMGFSAAYIRFYTKMSVDEPQKVPKLNGMYLMIFIVISIISCLFGTLLVFNVTIIFHKSFTAGEIAITERLMILMVANVAIAFISSVFDSYIMAHEQFKFQQSRQIAQTILAPALTVPLVLIGMGAIAITLVQTLITIFFLYLNINFAVKKLGMLFEFHDLPFLLLKDLTLFSFFIFLNQIVDLVNNNVPNFLLGMNVGAKEVATFAIAIQIKNMFFNLSTSVSNVFVPQVNKLVSIGASNKTLTNLMIKVGRMQMTILFFILGGFIVIGKYFVEKWAGIKNIDAYYLVIIMTLPSLVPLCQNVGIEIQRAQNKHIFRSISYIAFAIASLFITYYGTRNFGLYAGSWGYVFNLIFANGVLMNWYYNNKMHLNMKLYWKNVLNILIPFFVAVFFVLGVSFFNPVNNFILFLLYGILYVFLYLFVYFRYVATSAEKKFLKIKKH
jgi:O-antigen/teichoic acid export membrane protein